MKPTCKRIISFFYTSFVVPFLFWGVAGQTSIVLAQFSGSFTATGDLTTPRHSHTATLLTNGSVLIAGGISGNGNDSGYSILSSAELYDPSTGRFTATGDMSRARAYHTATLLPDGKVLIAGGWRPTTSSAELYDPLTGTFTPAGEMAGARSEHTATLLPNGKVLIAGGWGLNGPVSSPEVYDPSTDGFKATGESTTQGFVKASLLSNGKVLIKGGWRNSARPELYDPGTGTFSHTGTGSTTYSGMAPVTASLLTNGKVLITLESDGYGAAELYDPSMETFTTAAFGNTSHLDHMTSAALLPDGTVLLTGRYFAEIYDSGTGTFSVVGSMLTGRASGSPTTLLPDGTILISGGWICCGSTAITSARAEVYHPAALVAAPALLSLSGDGRGQGAIQHAGTSRIVSAIDPAVAGEYLTMYATGLLDRSVIPPQVAIGGQMAEVLFFGKTPGFANLNQINVRVPVGVAAGPAIPVRLNYVGRVSNEVTIGVR